MLYETPDTQGKKQKEKDDARENPENPPKQISPSRKKKQYM